METLNQREISTILAALRMFQEACESQNISEMFPEIFEDVAPLSVQEIEELCEKINCTIS